MNQSEIKQSDTQSFFLSIALPLHIEVLQLRHCKLVWKSNVNGINTFLIRYLGAKKMLSVCLLKVASFLLSEHVAIMLIRNCVEERFIYSYQVKWNIFSHFHYCQSTKSRAADRDNETSTKITENYVNIYWRNLEFRTMPKDYFRLSFKTTLNKKNA